MVLGWTLIYSLIPVFSRDFWRRRDVHWFLAAYFVPVGLVLFGVNGWEYTQINSEGAQEVQCGYGFLAQSSDLGMFKMGFLGYPVRQYLLAALPSFLWGKSLVTLRMGFGGLYLLGYLSFLQGA
jgi:hypothetical protein